MFAASRWALYRAQAELAAALDAGTGQPVDPLGNLAESRDSVGVADRAEREARVPRLRRTGSVELDELQLNQLSALGYQIP